jgi:hypothetical protein
MSLWNTVDTNTSGAKPKFAKSGSPIDPDNVLATDKGWELVTPTYTDCNGNTRTKSEILVAIGGLSGASMLAAATITAAKFRAATVAGGANINLDVVYNEKVTVTGTPTFTIRAANTTSRVVPASRVLSYVSGSGTNKLVFRATAYSNAAVYYLQSGSIANTAGVNIKDTGTSVASDLTIPANYTGSNSAIGTVTVS